MSFRAFSGRRASSNNGNNHRNGHVGGSSVGETNHGCSSDSPVTPHGPIRAASRSEMACGSTSRAPQRAAQSENESARSEGTPIPTQDGPVVTNRVNPPQHIVPSDMDGKPVLNAIKEMFGNSYIGPWTSFGTASKEQKRIWVDEFKLKFSWDGRDKVEIMRRFENRAGDWLKKQLLHARRARKAPKWMDEVHFADMFKHWDTEEYKKKCEIAKKNRASPAAEGSTYRGGSISTSKHKNKLKTKLGRDPKPDEIFAKTHKKKGTSDWGSNRAKRVKERYDSVLSQRSQVGDGAPIDEMEIFMEASGPPKKGKVFGMGNLVKDVLAGSTSSVTSSSRSKAEIQLMLEETEKRFAAEIDRRVVAEREVYRAHHDMVASILQSALPGVQLPAFPLPPPTSDSAAASPGDPSAQLDDDLFSD